VPYPSAFAMRFPREKALYQVSYIFIFKYSMKEKTDKYVLRCLKETARVGAEVASSGRAVPEAAACRRKCLFAYPTAAKRVLRITSSDDDNDRSMETDTV